MIKTRGVRPNLTQRPENKFAIVLPVHRQGIVRLPATEGIDASARRCVSRSTREVHNTTSFQECYQNALNACIIYGMLPECTECLHHTRNVTRVHCTPTSYKECYQSAMNACIVQGMLLECNECLHHTRNATRVQ